ncbi:MAG: SDR family NAD(P)-dependent oxidoreductase [Pseudomonadota bacterium]
MTADAPLCLIFGAGPGNGQALCDRFRQAGFRVALLARDMERLKAMAGGDTAIHPVSCDVSESAAIEAACNDILAKHGAPKVVIDNAGSGMFGTPLDTALADFESAWRINALGLLQTAQSLAPAMIENGGGALLITGATASLRGGAGFAAFASAKAAQRNLAQSLARSLGPEGLHVALFIIDGVIDIPRARELFGDKPDDFYMQATDIAETFFHVAHQPPSAWTFEVDLRRSGESW